jgi:hypothetical protein
VSGFTGYDYQMGNIVAGVLGDFDFGSVTGDIWIRPTALPAR